MSMQMVIHYWCDNPETGHAPHTVEGDTIIVYSRMLERLVELDFCEMCLDEMSDSQMQDLADSFGRNLEDRDPRTNPELMCPFDSRCNKGKPYKSAQRRQSHLDKKHPAQAAQAA